jgi:hypothetical protein
MIILFETFVDIVIATHYNNVEAGLGSKSACGGYRLDANRDKDPS